MSDIPELSEPLEDAPVLEDPPPPRAQPDRHQATRPTGKSSVVAQATRPRLTASTEIPAGLPYDPEFAERVPLLQTFRHAMANAMAFHRDVFEAEGVWHVAEAGVYRGRSLRALVQTAAALKAKVKFLGLDSFEGFPRLGEQDLEQATPNAKYVREHLFSDTTEREVLAYLSDADANNNVTLIKGFFKDTLASLNDQRYVFVNIDCDLYDGHIETLEYFYPRMLQGGIIFLDDYFSKEYPMAKSAVDAFMIDKPELVFSLRYGEAPHALRKGFIVKATG
ncbi:TylF/MycF/NovP-related O-methyltransferase [Phenylobacterium sp.]|uniref:TylF/MycF/NovP-related O-methyltransferase n=1 Tax=Phenylobacterium sp. TaxID=1871053 RepID=UPI002FC83459